MRAQPWGWWTGHKLEILEDYLQAFTTAGKKVDARIYLDLFAGWPRNKERVTDREIMGSVHRALMADPPFTHIGLFELPEKAERLGAAVATMYPHRAEDIRVFPGDCNVTITRALRDLYQVRYAPTFAFIDQFAAEVSWSTFEHLSRFRPQHLTKPELWLLFGTSFLPRGLRVTQEHMDAKFGDRISAMYGCDDWFPIVRGRREGQLSPADMRSELINLMRFRLEEVLGYRTTHAFTLKNTNGQDLYTMIFATDHGAGARIMSRLYGNAIGRHDEMLRDAQARRRHQRAEQLNEDSGIEALFDVDIEEIHAPPIANNLVYRHEPPWEPFGYPKGGRQPFQ